MDFVSDRSLKRLHENGLLSMHDFDKHGCHTALHSKLKKTKTRFLRYTGYLNSINTPIKQDILIILVLVRQQSFLNG